MRLYSLARVGCLAAAVALLGESAQATVPGANGIIAYVRDGAIWSMNADGTHKTKLTTASGFQDPVWSPDGSKIAFSTAKEVAVMNADGSGIKRIADGRVPTWSPDGKRLAYTCGGGFGQICAVGVNGGAVATLTRTAGRSATWSPDGR